MQFYQKGVYDSLNCSRLKVNHAMLVVGYDNSTYSDYWIVKNRYKSNFPHTRYFIIFRFSWGGYWGMSGYIYMAKDMYNQCGIATDASYPTLGQANSSK